MMVTNTSMKLLIVIIIRMMVRTIRILKIILMELRMRLLMTKPIGYGDHSHNNGEDNSIIKKI